MKLDMVWGHMAERLGPLGMLNDTARLRTRSCESNCANILYAPDNGMVNPL